MFRVGCVQSWLCSALAVLSVGCVQSWLCQELAVFKPWLCSELAVFRVGCVKRWLCQALAVFRAGCVQSWLYSELAVSRVGCVQSSQSGSPSAVDIFTTCRDPLLKSPRSDCAAGVVGNTSCECLTVFTAVGKWLHTLPSQER